MNVPCVLITGFEPFAEETVNPSECIVRALEGEERAPEREPRQSGAAEHHSSLLEVRALEGEERAPEREPRKEGDDGQDPTEDAVARLMDRVLSLGRADDESGQAAGGAFVR